MATINATDKYGIVADFKVSSGQIDEFIGGARGHFVRQHDGREPGAQFAAILMPSEAEPDVCSFFEQWGTKEDYDAHSAPNENLKFFLDNFGGLLAEPPSIRQGTMQHWFRQGSTGTKYGIIVKFNIAEGKMDDFVALACAHFDRQHDGREANANMATILQPAAEEDANTVYFFEQWESQADYEAHSAPNENLQVFLDTVPTLVAGPPEIRPGNMPHWQKESEAEAGAQRT
mmetsp:Transcript_36977/g.73189  ORF Transcript_36977/g.73189 Transcript_36977/m.73189 type:complete len:231 (-) Transcript_36977:132-824(-)